MSQYKTGTASVTNLNEKVYITGDGVDLQGNVSVGQTFKRKDENAIYNILDIDEDGGGEFIKIAPAYQGATATGVEYQITRDFTPNLALTEMNEGDVDWPFHITVGVIRKLDTLLSDLANTYRKLQRMYIGMPEEGREFGEMELISSRDLVEITVSAISPPAGGNVGLDMAINGSYQSTGLTLPDGQYSNPVTIALSGVAGDVIKFKFTSVPAGIFPGQHYTIDVKYRDTGTLEIRQEFMRPYPGMAENGKRIGRGYKPAVKSRFFGGMITAQAAPLGSPLTIALMHEDIQKAQTLALAAGSKSQYTSFAQLDCLTTETIDTIITAVGSDFPGDNITVTLYSYRIT